MKINPTWSSHLPQEEREKFENRVKGSKDVLDRLLTLISQKEEELNRSENVLAQYDNPNWHFRQAHQNGYRSCQSKIQKLINLDQGY